jgi:hypothetical protein
VSNGESTNINFIIFGLTRPALKPIIYHTPGGLTRLALKPIIYHTPGGLTRPALKPIIYHIPGGLTRLALKPIIYHTPGEHASNYITYALCRNDAKKTHQSLSMKDDREI